MKELEQQKEVIKQFLLGELNEERREQVEERLLTDTDYRDEVLMIEGELVEDYLTEKLPPDDRSNFEKHYLSAPRQQRNLKLTKVLLEAAKTAPAPANNFLHRFLHRLRDIFWPRGHNLRYAVVALILIGVVGSIVAYRAWRSSSQSAELQAELIRLNTSGNILSPSSSVPSVTLLPFNLRDIGSLPRLTVASASEVAQLRVTIAPNNYQNYNVTVNAIADTQEIKFDVKPQSTGNTLILQLPARVLKPNDYLVTIRGVNAQGATEDVGEYAFRVVQQ